MSFTRRVLSGNRKLSQGGLLEQVKEMIDKSYSVSDCVNLVNDIYRFGKKNEEEFIKALVPFLLKITEVKSTAICIFLDNMVNNAQHVIESQSWAKAFSGHILEVSKHMFSIDLIKEYFKTAIVPKWIKKRIFEGNIIKQLSDLVEGVEVLKPLDEKDEVTEKITGKRKREDPAEGDEKVVKKKKEDEEEKKIEKEK